MKYAPHNGGRIAEGNTPFGSFRVVWDGDNHLIEAQNNPRDPSDKPVTQPNTTLGQKLKGAVGLAKTELGISLANDDVVKSRQEICEGCDHYDFGRCMGTGGCQCYLYAKVRQAHEKCPMGKW